MADESQSQTQPQAKQLMTDIFGSDDEDDNNVQHKPSTTSASKFDDSDDDIFAGSDDDDKKGPTTSKAASSAKPALDDENLMDSDDEDVILQQKGATRRKRSKAPPAQVPKKKGKLQKRKSTSAARERSSGDSGNEYDSGEDVMETKDDRNFIDGDDDFADIVKEYDEDNTEFNDEAPDEDYRGGKKSKKSHPSGGGAHLSSGINLKDQDPLSQTLAAMKNPKAMAQTDQQKDIMVEKLQIQMAKAVKLDNESFARQEPAVAKMQLLDTVRTTISMKPLHQTLLDKDILSNLRDWIEPRDANTLPALSVRTTVYELLMQLPCLPDHLKRSNGEKPPIGVVIVSLRKHKMETTANKRLLKELMDKWSRPIFSKSADVRVGSGAGALPTAEHPEVAEAIMQRYLSQSQRSSSQQSQGGGESSRASSGQSRVGFGSVLSGRADSAGSSSEAGADGEPKKAPDLYTRARTPYNTGFLFTVQPELKSIDKRNVMERSLGEGRMKLFKKMSEGGGGKALGRKANPRYVHLLVNLWPLIVLLDVKRQ